jgi:putative SOS response-associated peptidase YedK
MCGRYTLRTPLSVLAKQFQAELLPGIEWEPRYNIPPTTSVPAMRFDEAKHRVLVRLKWGLIPS